MRIIGSSSAPVLTTGGTGFVGTKLAGRLLPQGRPVRIFDKPPLAFGGWRIGDQRWYLSDCSKPAAATGWRGRVGVAEGIGPLHAWLMANRRAAPGLRAEAV